MYTRSLIAVGLYCGDGVNISRMIRTFSTTFHRHCDLAAPALRLGRRSWNPGRDKFKSDTRHDLRKGRLI